MKTILLIQCRVFGDAIIFTQVINSLAANFPDWQIDLFTKSEFSAIYENCPYLNKIYYSKFPIGIKNFKLKDTAILFKEILKLRKNKYDYCLNIIGDFREVIITKLINPVNNISVKWDKNHPMKKLIRNGFTSFIDKEIIISNDVLNIYSVIEKVVKEIGGDKNVKSSIVIKNNNLVNLINEKEIIAFHPIASQQCRMWDFINWKNIIDYLLKKNYQIFIFCSSNEKDMIENEFFNYINNTDVSIISGNLNNLFKKLSSVKLLIGLDSFSVHAAYALNIPNIMLSGANDYRIWQPPNTVVVSAKEKCIFYPCYNRPRCINKSFKYMCMSKIKTKDVFEAIEQLI